jgi:uncharacterized protein YdcH (DUF465 family)
MTHVPHELHDELPEFAEKIHEMKTSSEHFRRLADRHHQVNREIHRIEAEVEPASDMRWEDLKKQRLALVDEIRAFLVASG